MTYLCFFMGVKVRGEMRAEGNFLQPLDAACLAVWWGNSS